MRTASIVFLVVLGWSLFCFKTYFRGANTFEFAHYAEIGRNIREGLGYRTRVVYPATLALLDERGLAGMDPAPVSDRFPFTAYLAAAGEALAGPGDLGPVLGTLAAFALWSAAVFLVGRRWFGTRAGLLAAVLFSLVPAVAKYFALFNLPDVLFGALLFLFHDRLAAARGRDPRETLALGLLAGLAWLARANFWLGLPVYLAVLWRLPTARRDKLQDCGLFLAAFLAVSSPALLYNLRWFGRLMTPGLVWNLAHHVVSDEQPWLFLRTYALADIVGANGPALAAKAADAFHTFLYDFPTLWQLQVLLPFAAAGLTRLPEGGAKRFFAINAAVFALQTPVFCFLRFDSWGLGVGYRYLLWLCPVLILASVHGLSVVGEALPVRARPWAAGAALALHLFLIAPFYTHDLTSIHLVHPSGQAPARWPELMFLRDNLKSGEGVVSNLPAHAAWYAGAYAVALPNDPADVVRIDKLKPLKYLWLSFINIGTMGDYPQWLPLLQNEGRGLKELCKTSGWTLKQAFPGAAIVDLHPGD